MDLTTILIIGALLTIIATILTFIFIIPDKKRQGLRGFGRFLHDFFNVKFLIIEKILQFCYVLATTFCIIGGFFMLFWFQEQYTFGSMMAGVSGGGGYGDIEKVWMGYYGVLVMVLGPILLRFAYELLMLAIIAVKNIIQINNKLKDQNDDPKPAPKAAPIPPVVNAVSQAPAPTAENPDQNAF